MWYDLTPAEYAEQLHANADCSEQNAKKYETQKNDWSGFAATLDRRLARRLRAMAILCEKSKAIRAGDVDFKGLNRPQITWSAEDRVIAEIERFAV